MYRIFQDLFLFSLFCSLFSLFVINSAEREWDGFGGFGFGLCNCYSCIQKCLLYI